MAKKKSVTRVGAESGGDHSRESRSVDDFLVTLGHTHDAMLRLVRRLVIEAHPAIEEGIKWNTVSFWKGDWFATFHLRAKLGLMLVVHRGAKAKAALPSRFVEDSDGIARWLANDRCTIQLDDIADVNRKAGQLQTFVRQWAEKMEQK